MKNTSTAAIRTVAQPLRFDVLTLADDVLDRAADSVRDILSAPPKVFLSDEQSREVKAVLVKPKASLAKLEVCVCKGDTSPPE